MEVAAGVISIAPTAKLSPAVIARIRQVAGVKSVKQGSAAASQ
jgi:hypothetical protein